MKKFVRIFFLIVVLLVIGGYIYFSVFVPEISNHFVYTGLEKFYPQSAYADNEYIEHSAFHLSYNEAYEQANWVVYLLTRTRLEQESVERTDYFRSDDAVSTVSAKSDDYTGSGYDRGHLAPAAVMAFDEEAMKESFYMSNISPQKPSFNRGGWRSLENLVREWAEVEDSLIVVTGPVFNEEAERIGENQVLVPDAFFKVILDITQPEIKTIAFLMPNEKIDKPLIEYALTVDELERRINYDFFARIPQKAVDPLEEVLNTVNWHFPVQ